MQVDLTSNYDDTDGSVQQLVNQLAPIHELTGFASWTINCSECDYLGPFAAVLLGAAFSNALHLGQKPTVILPNTPPKLAAFCLFSGMKSLFEGDPNPDFDHPESETVPLSPFVEARWNLADDTLRLIRRHIEIDDELEESVRTCISEVAQNVVDHAKSPIGGLLCGRFIASRRELRIAIVDRGIGVFRSLGAKHNDVISSFDALSRVIKGGHSAESRPNNMGLGISNLCLLMQHLGGRITLISGDARARIIPGKDNHLLDTLSTPFPGTAVFFTIPTTE